MEKIDFFIVGAMRSGTSSLRDGLMLNPVINMARGEPRYFSHPAKYPGGVKEYHSLFDWGDQHSLRGDKSPTYAVLPHAAENIARYNPKAKIIWTMREPVKRAISHFQHSSFRLVGKATEPFSIRYAVENRDELERARHPMAYIYRSEYHKHILNWLRFFPREQHYFIILEEMLTDPESELRRLHDFLGVPWHEKISLPQSKKKKMAEFTEGLTSDREDVGALRSALSGTKEAVEDLLGRQIPAWRTKDGVR